MLPKHDVCGEPLYTPKIIFKEQGETKYETTDPYVWCRKCKKYVEVEVTQK
ncbi:hypothetical protein LCGC14_0380730 [marine sediment metagenome]|uniref:Uncharacterized protein n=1 Tax=marine sediment metagenome TaxID=412755 RepID=A0A0F9TKN8_9ZZZZ